MRAIARFVILIAVAGCAGCGGQSQYSQEESYDIVECSLAGWGVVSLPRRACERQGGLSLTPVPYRGPGPYNAPTIEERREQERRQQEGQPR